MCQRINGSAQDELLALLSSPQMTGALESSNVEAVSQLCLLRDRCDSLQNFQALQDWLAEFIAVEVPKDGNCGAWSVQALINGNPFQQPRAEDNIKLRNEIAALWLKVSSDILWQSIFFEIVCPFDRVVDEDDLPMIVSEKIVPKKEPKIEPGPARRAKPRPTIFMDLSSPPRPQVEQVGASRPVFTRKTHRDDLPSCLGSDWTRDHNKILRKERMRMMATVKKRLQSPENGGNAPAKRRQLDCLTDRRPV